MHTLRDAKVKYNYDMPTVAGKEDGYYQSIDFDTTALPEIALWQVGEEYTIILKVRETRHELVKSEDNGIKEKACFEILEVGSFADGMEENREKVKNKLK